ncbi:PQQ-dependent dehydrogenase, methanol/ethanol family [Croceicoccus ponticola]|uniref:PQQ-dependent dehydrogenase, methanol/ethanol family n=1 Tax=Croceicoccus ponticola TaxID=2217664 RepID=UPI001F0C6762|nr:PQQ-dependent dehydrogenase, methanol/ethanol family [Croceicoccus ponticola]
MATAPTANSAIAQLADDSSGDDWPGFGRTYGEQHYSPLTQIDLDTVGGLGLAWSHDLVSNENSATGPIEIDDVVYFASGYSHVQALDAQTGKMIWEYDPGAAEAAGRRLRQGWGSRGVAWWDGMIYTGTQDGRLIAIDARTGKPVWSVMTLEEGDYRFISGPPRVFDGKVIIGHGGADAAATRGYVTAYDAQTGKQLWRFYTVPGNPADGFEDDAQAMAAGTWSGEWWKHGGGGTVWNAITYDADLNRIYIGTGNGAPWDYRIRSEGKGDNLFLSSIVALDANTGKYIWHYQTNPAESWDYNASMDIELADLPIRGTLRKVLMTAPKNGFFYVIDRTDGKLISAEKYVPVTWATGIDMKTGRPIEADGLRSTDRPFTMAPGTFGAHSWMPMAFSPKTSLAYIPAIQSSTVFDPTVIDPGTWQRPPDNVLDGGIAASFPLDNQPSSALVAIDPLTQKQRWRVETPGFVSGGVLATGGGLVFQGHVDGTFNAFDAETGRKVWSFDAGTAIIGPPISYRAGGRQYVTVLSGLGTSSAYLGPMLAKYNLTPAKQRRRVLTFALGGKVRLPVERKSPVEISAEGLGAPDPAAEDAGFPIYAQRCAVCHGMRAVAVGPAPDLRASMVVRSPDALASVLEDGILASRGMPKFDELSAGQREQVRKYILAMARADRADTQSKRN